MMSKSENENKSFNFKKIAFGVFNLKREYVTIKHISCVKNFCGRLNPTILTSSRKEELKIVLDKNKDESQRSAEHVLTEPSVMIMIR